MIKVTGIKQLKTCTRLSLSRRHEGRLHLYTISIKPSGKVNKSLVWELLQNIGVTEGDITTALAEYRMEQKQSEEVEQEAPKGIWDEHGFLREPPQSEQKQAECQTVTPYTDEGGEVPVEKAKADDQFKPFMWIEGVLECSDTMMLTITEGSYLSCERGYGGWLAHLQIMNEMPEELEKVYTKEMEGQVYSSLDDIKKHAEQCFCPNFNEQSSDEVGEAPVEQPEDDEVGPQKNIEDVCLINEWSCDTDLRCGGRGEVSSLSRYFGLELLKVNNGIKCRSNGWLSAIHGVIFDSVHDAYYKIKSYIYSNSKDDPELMERFFAEADPKFYKVPGQKDVYTCSKYTIDDYMVKIALPYMLGLNSTPDQATPKADEPEQPVDCRANSKPYTNYLEFDFIVKGRELVDIYKHCGTASFDKNAVNKINAAVSKLDGELLSSVINMMKSKYVLVMYQVQNLSCPIERANVATTVDRLDQAVRDVIVGLGIKQPAQRDQIQHKLTQYANDVCMRDNDDAYVAVEIDSKGKPCGVITDNDDLVIGEYDGSATRYSLLRLIVAADNDMTWPIDLGLVEAINQPTQPNIPPRVWSDEEIKEAKASSSNLFQDARNTKQHIEKAVREAVRKALPADCDEDDVADVVSQALNPDNTLEFTTCYQHHKVALAAGIATRDALLKQTTIFSQPVYVLPETVEIPRKKWKLKAEWVEKPYGFKLVIGKLTFIVEREYDDKGDYRISDNVAYHQKELSALELKISDLVYNSSCINPFALHENPKELMDYITKCANTAIKDINDQIQQIAEVQHD